MATAKEMEITNERSLKLLARMYAENDVKEDVEKVRKGWLTLAGSDSEDRARVAVQYLAFDQPEHARAIVEIIREENPDWEGLELLKGRILTAEENYQKATEKLRSALNREPKNLAVRNDLVTVLLRSGKIDEAVKVVEEGTHKNSDQAAAWYLKGLAYEKKEDIQTAKSAYERALEINPKHTQTLINLAVITAQEDQNGEKAVKLLETALNNEPHNPVINYNLGWVLAMSGIDHERGFKLLIKVAQGQGEMAQKARNYIDRAYEGIRDQAGLLIQKSVLAPKEQKAFFRGFP